MLHDLIGTNRIELDNFLSNPERAFIISPGYTKHKHRSIASSISVRFDKYFYEILKKFIVLNRPRQGAFSGKSIYDLVEIHKKSKYVLKTDIKNYFGSIKFKVFKKLASRDKAISKYIDEIKSVYFKNETLRRGLIASPLISEVIGLKIDEIINREIHRSNLDHNLCYSRYYDDIIISGDNTDELGSILEEVRKSLKNNLGLDIKNKKTKISVLNGLKILGLVVYEKEVTVPKYFKNKLRAIMNSYINLSESDLDSVYLKLSCVGTIIASHHYIINNSPNINTTRYRVSIREYYDELTRLKQLRDKYTGEKEEENATGDYPDVIRLW